MCYGICQFERWDGECGNHRAQGKPGSGCYEAPECEDCDGTGKVWVSCCGDIFKQQPDIDICPTCGEHSIEEDICEKCNGEGKLKEE